MTKQQSKTTPSKATARAPSGNTGPDRRRSKLLSLALRHNPGALGLVLDEHGWADVDAVLAGMQARKVRCTPDDLKRVVENCDKQRFCLEEGNGRIRANQGHSLDVELDLEPQVPPSILFHGTSPQTTDAIFREGLKRMNRQHVHLSADQETAIRVGSRRGSYCILVVETKRMTEDGFVFFCSANGVWLTDSVPPTYLSRLEEPVRS